MKAKRICLEKTSPEEPAETLCVSSQNHQTSKDITLIGRRIIDIGLMDLDLYHQGIQNKNNEQHNFILSFHLTEIVENN
ncbi:hypothetical protein HNY73_006403 [Argiope bruennichi]|uniref:Uncharacterized protein n=1 Tax=Argiope bruennichi TaxID=94029 RepID=A0A8T0FKT2_ARGBR|nr:hypothetical protein HNY73_006403 [Argiope bruennichi]